MTEQAPHCPACGVVLDAHVLSSKPGKPRSYDHLKRYMALCRAAYDHWPEAETFQPKNVAHLRYFLEMKAGFCEVTKTIRCESVDPDHLVSILTAVLRSCDDDKAFVEVDGALVTVKRALSASYAAMGHLTACKMFEAVEQEIENAIGVKAQQLLSERAA